MVETHSLIGKERAARADRSGAVLVYAAHFTLAALMVISRASASIAESDGSFARTGFGRAIESASILCGVAALAWIAVGTLRAWRDSRLLVLAAFLVASLWHRRGPLDVFDLAYASAVAMACAWRFARGRRARAAAE